MLSARLVEKLSSAKVQATALSTAQRQGRSTMEGPLSSFASALEGNSPNIEQEESVTVAIPPRANVRRRPSIPKFQLRNSPQVTRAAAPLISSQRPQTARRAQINDGTSNAPLSKGNAFALRDDAETQAKEPKQQHAGLLPPAPQLIAPKPRYAEWSCCHRALMRPGPTRLRIRRWRSCSLPSETRSQRP